MPVTEAPYDPNGNLQHYPANTYQYDPETKTSANVPCTWRPNEPFTATLKLTGMERGRSAAYFYLADADGHEFPLFMKDLHDMLVATDVTHGIVTGRWHVVKRGQNYGLRYLGPADDADQALLITRAELIDALAQIHIPEMPLPKDGVITLSAESLADQILTALGVGGPEVQV
ncbi:hypothetical protein ACQEVF_59135 [Nonomuraea polychroma]|uniref:hypothetical protein n=1 Tax=Nonomuraea polychroma TaxID=46176 RepID=UPI003D8E2E9F